MAGVVTWVSGRIDAARHDDVVTKFSAAVEGGPPPAIERTILLRDGDEISIVTTWRSREALEATIASPEEPLARRLIREAGGTPTIRVFDVVVTG
jgi:hypothetical protein